MDLIVFEQKPNKRKRKEKKRSMKKKRETPAFAHSRNVQSTVARLEVAIQTQDGRRIWLVVSANPTPFRPTAKAILARFRRADLIV